MSEETEVGSDVTGSTPPSPPFLATEMVVPRTLTDSERYRQDMLIIRDLQAAASYDRQHQRLADNFARAAWFYFRGVAATFGPTETELRWQRARAFRGERYKRKAEWH